MVSIVSLQATCKRIDELEVLVQLVLATVFKTVGLHGNHVAGGFDSHALPPSIAFAVGQTSDGFHKTAELPPVNFDVDFSVPQRHRVRFTSNLAGRDFEVLTELIVVNDDIAPPPKVLLIVDQGVANTAATSQLISRLSASKQVRVMDCSSVSVRQSKDVSLKTSGDKSQNSPAYFMMGGEICKNDTDDVEKILGLINRFDFDRRSFIVAVGGGALLDTVGFAAATAHRGVRLIRIPTTTLAQSDSGVGVKNAINYFNKKNWLGTFAVPWAVINDQTMLHSLSDRDFCCGFSEAVKVSLLKSPEDFEFLCRNAAGIRRRETEVTFEAIKQSCLHHLKHITQGGDPFETKEARPLDFGHWSAHKLEAITEYRVRHGEAVAIGVMLDCIYSSRVHGLPEEVVRDVGECFAELGLRLWHDSLDAADLILSGLEEFRQHLGGRLTITLLEDVGKPIDVHEIDMTQMRNSIRDLDQWCQVLQTRS